MTILDLMKALHSINHGRLTWKKYGKHMKKKTALVTGVSGQDGAYLAALLLKKKI